MARRRTLAEHVRDWLRLRVERDGTPATARALGLADATVARAVGGLPVQAGTVVLLETAYERREAA